MKFYIYLNEKMTEVEPDNDLRLTPDQIISVQDHLGGKLCDARITNLVGHQYQIQLGWKKAEFNFLGKKISGGELVYYLTDKP